MNKAPIKAEYQLKINRNIIGGYDGLKKLFEIFITDSIKNGCCDFNNTNFEEFVNGETKKLLGWKSGNDYKINSNDDNNYHFTNFYETNFSFEFTNSLFDFGNKYLLQGTLNLIEKFKSEENIIEIDIIEFIKSILMRLETEIKKSNNCKEVDNPKLFEKLIYMKNGYIETYNKVYDLYSHYFPNLLKVDFKKTVVIENVKNLNESTTTVKKTKLQKTIFEYIINVSHKGNFLIELKNTFTTEKGRDIRIIVDYLKSESIVVIQDREKKNFVSVLNIYFGRDIGSVQGIFDKMKITEEKMKPIVDKLKPLIDKYKTKI